MDHAEPPAPIHEAVRIVERLGGPDRFGRVALPRIERASLGEGRGLVTSAAAGRQPATPVA